ncbi:hypothetical protein E2C01_061692 [Portunus trituberculatus]|uniref:Uncharacterized protein n=1 Tax=Portunus trituberculatus TaxID=210409 RepID=A0A5B7HD33_PORTR|nr:hypothetical protein [Portunus trituberculatus]
MRDLWYETYLDLDQLTYTGVTAAGQGDLAFPHLTSSHVTYSTLPVTSSTPSPPVPALAPIKSSPDSPEAPADFGYNLGEYSSPCGPVTLLSVAVVVVVVSCPGAGDSFQQGAAEQVSRGARPRPVRLSAATRDAATLCP